MGRCFFAGSNSGNGFYNLFQNLTPEWEKKNHFYILKGGPGVGKNTLMKKVAAHAEETGETVERFFCSGDPESLDAVRLVERGILLADGTAPHCIDPCYPGAADEILNFGEQINRARIKEKRREVELLTDRNKISYRRAYAFLRAAAALRVEWYESLSKEIHEEKAFCFLTKLLEQKTGSIKEKNRSCFKEFAPDPHGKPEGEGWPERRLFLSAYTCFSEVSLKSTFFPEEQIEITGMGSEVIVDWISTRIFSEKKELFCDPLLPERVNHMNFPDINLFLTSGTTECEEMSGEKRMYSFSMEDFSVQSRFLKEKGKLFKEEEDGLISLAQKELAECKRLHDELELLYRECVDFEAITKRSEEFLQRLFCESDLPVDMTEYV